MPDSNDLPEIIETQLAANGGVCSLACTDGHVFTFTRELLEKLLARSLETGRVVVFVKRSEPC